MVEMLTSSRKGWLLKTILQNSKYRKGLYKTLVPSKLAATKILAGPVIQMCLLSLSSLETQAETHPLCRAIQDGEEEGQDHLQGRVQFMEVKSCLSLK